MTNQDTMDKPSFNHRILTRSVSTFTPAVRMVIIRAFAYVRGEGEEIVVEHEIIPVLGIEVRVTDRYHKRDHGGDNGHQYRTHRELIEAGWSYKWQNVVISPLFLDNDHRSIMSLESDADFLMDEGNIFRVVACPWPPSEDEERLKGHVLKAVAAARERIGLTRDPAPPLTGSP